MLVITIIVIIIISTAVIISMFQNGGIIDNAKKAVIDNNQSVKSEKIMLLLSKLKLDNSLGYKSKIPKTDFVQPWLVQDYSLKQMNDYMLTLKKAGIDNLIVQYSSTIENGKVKSTFFDSNYASNESNQAPGFYSTKDCIDKILSAAQNNGVKIYMGLSMSDDWWSERFKDEAWINSTMNVYNILTEELYTKYSSKYADTFVGWYFPFEIYTTHKNHEIYWSKMVKSNTDKINTLNGSMPLVLSPYISAYEKATSIRAGEMFRYICENSGLTSKDIMFLQDYIGTNNDTTDEYIDMLNSIKNSIKSSNIRFGINVENFVDEKDLRAAKVERVLNQIELASYFADELAIFSYSHYYNPKIGNVSSEFDQLYRSSLGISDYTSIVAPNGGIVYKDKNGDLAPIPKGFTVSDKENEKEIKEGLVIKDFAQNEFVWIPVDSGINNTGEYENNINEKDSVIYKKWWVFDTYTDDTQLNGIIEENQIRKYRGFYIGRYESSYEYNSGNSRPMVKRSTRIQADFTWNDASISNFYNGTLWNRISYTDAKNKAFNASHLYSYDSTVKTGLVTARQWDTTLRWIKLNGKIVNDTSDFIGSRGWGNYSDSITPANVTGFGTYQNTGFSDHWKSKNIYDLAGNLREWTLEKKGTEYILRSGSYLDSGNGGSAMYRLPSANWQDERNGFRLALYID